MDMKRMEELMKKMELQMRMEDMANKMDELAKKEDQINQQTETANKTSTDKKDNGKTDKQNGTDKETKDQNGKTADGDKKDSKADTGKDVAGKEQQKAGKNTDAQKSDEKKTTEQLSREQKDLKAELDKAMKEDMKEMEKLGKETKKDDALDDPKQQGEDAEHEMQESSDDLDQKQNSKAAKAQQNAKKNLQEMAKSLRKKAQEGQEEEVDIDIRMTRQILSNLIRLSFDQENLMSAVRITSTSSPLYLDNQREQNRLRGNAKMVQDSLFELSKRVSKLSTSINQETMDLENSMSKAVDAIEDRLVGPALTHEQYAMTHTNNLALTLNELLANLIQMQNSGPKNGSCAMPGGKKPGKSAGEQLSDIITGQQQMGGKMQQMQGQGQKPGQGKNPGQGSMGQSAGQGQPGSQPGGQSGTGSGQSSNGTAGNGEYGNSEQLARLAEQQANLRRKIQELSSLLNSKGMNGVSKQLRDVEQQMDKNETDIANRRMSSELMQRQKEILSRLLEADKAVREQEQDDKRSSNTGKELERPLPEALQKYITDQKQLLDLYKTVPPQLKPYYKDMVENYFKIIGER
jgi:hypothetical protein